MNIAVVGYPYVRENYRATLEMTDAYFVLPRAWKIKKGKVDYRVKPSERIITTTAFFYHSNYPFIGGLLKGWMPLVPYYLWKLKRHHGIRLVFDADEPNLLTTLYNGISAKILGLKLIVFSWQNVALIHRSLIKLNLLLADGIICGNQKSNVLFRAITQKPSIVIPLAGLDSDYWTPAPRPQRYPITFLFAGALDYRKGIHILLDAFEKIPDARLILVGSGTYEDEIKNQISKMQKPVEVIPWADHMQLKKLYQDADIFIYPSISHGGWEEQFGYSMAEASLMELPVIATRTGSIEEVVKDGKTGILVEPNNVQQLADTMMRLANNSILRQTQGQAGREFVTNRYSNSVVVEKLNIFLSSFR